MMKERRMKKMSDVKTVYDKFSENGLFAALNKVAPLPFNITPSTCDILYNNRYGSRLLARFGRDNDVSTIATVLQEMFYEKWTNAWNSYQSYADMILGDKETTEEKVTDNNVNNGTNTDVNTVSAYNDENFVNDDKKSTEIHNEIKNNRTRNKTVTKTNIDTVEKVSKLLQNDFLYDTIFIDVNTVLTLDIFD